MSDIAHHLLRRGIDATQQNFNNGSDGQDDQIKQIATWGIALIWVTGVLYLAMMSAVCLQQSSRLLYAANPSARSPTPMAMSSLPSP